MPFPSHLPRAYRYLVKLGYRGESPHWEGGFWAGASTITPMVGGASARSPEEALHAAYEKIEEALARLERAGEPLPPPYADFPPHNSRMRAVLTLVVSDPERSRAFYHALGYDVNNYFHVDFEEGTPEPEHGPRLSYYAHAESLVPELVALGGTVVEVDHGKGPDMKPYGEMRLPCTTVADPDGYRIEIITPVLY